MHLLAKAFARPSAPQPALRGNFVHAPSGLTLIRSAPQEEVPLPEPHPPDVALFTYRFDSGPRLTPVVVSILIHGVAVAIICFGLAYKPPIARVDTQHYTARRIDLHTPDQQKRAGISYPVPYFKKSTPASGERSSSTRQWILRQVPHIKLGPQTLIQPDLLAQVTLTEEIPIPQVIIWTPSKTQVKNIVPPLPQKPTAADVKPTYDAPNQEVNLANVNVASSNQSKPSTLVAASTTSPVAVHQPEQVELPPVSATQNSAQPTPAAILSLSDLRMKDGTAALPPVNESAASSAQGAPAMGRAQDSSPQSNSNPAAKQGQAGAGPGSHALAAEPATIAPPQGGELPSESSRWPTLTQISLPRDGRFSAVIVGDALEDLYPEIAGAWSGRIAYTAYLHVGLAKSWILQYSLPRDADASAGGRIARLDAPWPYNIVRPNLAPGSVNADVLMIHGYVDLSGRFQSLSVAFPPAFPRAQFVLDALEQWQFRPAIQDGQPARVEVLLIIPETDE